MIEKKLLSIYFKRNRYIFSQMASKAGLLLEVENKYAPI